MRGRDHPAHGAVAVESVSQWLAVATSAGARPKRHPPLDPNEDCAAVVDGDRALLLVIGDAHRGCEAAELAIAYVVGVLGPDPRPGDLTEDEIVTLMWDAGMEVQRGVGIPTHRHPNSRTTLAFALVSSDVVQWASFGDSAVLIANLAGVMRLDVPRSIYLGYSFSRSEIGALVTTGIRVRSGEDKVILATDGLVDCGLSTGRTLESFISLELNGSLRASETAQRLVDATLRHDATDAVTVAVAVGR